MRTLPMVATFLLIAALTAPDMARTDAEAPLSFIGALVAVTPTSVLVRQVDGILIGAELPSDGPLSAGTLASAYAFGENVQMDCTRLSTPVYDALSGNMRYLQLSGIFDLGKPSQAGLQAAEASRAASTAGNRLRPNPMAATDAAAVLAGMGTSQPQPSDTAATGTDIAHLRADVIEYLNQMPNYIASESGVRSTSWPASPGGPPTAWRPLDVIDDTVTIIDGGLTRSDIRRNGSRWERPYAALPGQKMLVPFWENPRSVVAPGCPATIDGGTPISDSGVAAVVFTFATPPDGCGSEYQEGFEEYYPGTAGQLVVSQANDSLLRMERHTVGFPPAFPLQSAAYEVTWGDINDGGLKYHVPTGATFIVQMIPGEWSRTVYTYKDYRKFSVSHKIIVK